MAKKGPYRRVQVVEILKDTFSGKKPVYKKDDVREMHPVLADRLIASEIAKKTTKKVTVGNTSFKGVVKTQSE